jgi:hypothetical protein
MAEFLRTQDMACLWWGTDQGTVVIAKLPARDIRSVRGRVPIHLRQELYTHPAAPVIRSVLTIYDRPGNPLALECYTNIEDEDQRADFARLAEQEHFLMFFYDEALSHRLTKVVTHRDPHTVQMILARAEQLLAAIPPPERDFDRAKEEVLREAQL